MNISELSYSLCCEKMNTQFMRQHFDLSYTVGTLEVDVSGFGIAYQ